MLLKRRPTEQACEQADADPEQQAGNQVAEAADTESNRQAAKAEEAERLRQAAIELGDRKSQELDCFAGQCHGRVRCRQCKG